jgi:hypothetical protein
MATIHGIDQFSTAQIEDQLRNGARFVVYQYCISIIVMSFKRSSGIYFIPAGGSAVGKGALWSLPSLLLGWWGIPWGPIWTIQSLWRNLGGGIDVTAQMHTSNAPNPSIEAAPLPPQA